jgi:hypothetical protein
MKKRPRQSDRKLELELQRATRCFGQAHREAHDLLWHAKALAEITRKRSRSTMGNLAA